MLTYENLAKKPKLFLSFTGITPSQFDVLYWDVEKQLEETEKKRLSARDRLRDGSSENSIGRIYADFLHACTYPESKSSAFGNELDTSKTIIKMVVRCLNVYRQISEELFSK